MRSTSTSGRHLEVVLDEIANEPIPEKLRALLDKLERKQEDNEPAPPGPGNPSQC